VTKTKAGEMMALVKVSDYTGRFEAAIFPKSYKILKQNLITNTPLVLKGKVASKNGERTMVVDGVSILE